jgi:hypothetical protein
MKSTSQPEAYRQVTQRFCRHVVALTREFMHQIGLKGFAEFRRAGSKFPPLERRDHAHVQRSKTWTKPAVFFSLIFSSREVLQNQRVFQNLEILVHGGAGHLGVVAHIGKINDRAVAERCNSKKPLKAGMLRVAPSATISCCRDDPA